MASFEEHISQATHNEEIANLLLYPACESALWVNVISFYTALQYMEAALTKTKIEHLSDYFSSLKRDGSNVETEHQVMQRLIYENRDFRDFYTEYRELRTASEAARYLKGNYKSFDKEKIARRNFEIYLDKIKRQLKRKKYI